MLFEIAPETKWFQPGAQRTGVNVLFGSKDLLKQ